MRRETGIIVQVDSGKALVETDPENDCASCESRHSCIPGIDGKKRRVWADNGIGAASGDEVVMEIDEKSVVASSMLLYLLPVILLLAGIVIGFHIYGPINSDRELFSILGGTIGLAISFILIRIISRYLRRWKAFSPVLVKVVKADREHKT